MARDKDIGGIPGRDLTETTIVEPQADSLNQPAPRQWPERPKSPTRAPTPTPDNGTPRPNGKPD